MTTPQRGSPDSGPPAAARAAGAFTRRGLELVRGMLGASALGAYTVAGAIGAFLALFPVVLHPPPRARGRSPAGAGAPVRPPESSGEPIAG